MLDVYFSSNKEVISFCEQLFYFNKNIELHWKIHEEWGNHLQIESKLLENETIEKVTEAMIEVFKQHRLSNMITGIIHDVYYYQNCDEIERILELSHEIIVGEDFQSMRSKKDPIQFLYTLFLTSVKESKTIHFDSIVNFRLKEFKDYVTYDVGLAIDEFKREEDHQEFVNTLREFIAKKDSKFNVIHIVQGSNFAFYRSDGKRLSKLDLRKQMQEEPLYIVGLDGGDEWNLAPLIAMSPRKIKIYGNDPSEPKTLTIINVFQERVDFEPYSKFPFTLDRKV